MCGRFDNLIARDAYRGLFKAQRLPKSNFPLRYNVAPTDQIPIVRIDPRDGEREVVMARWGLIPFWMKEKPKVPHINARAETVHKLPLFREAFAKRLVSFRRRDFTSGRSGKMASSPIASAEKTSNLSFSRACGSSLG
jgi:putative SOS response-associated peptidase YedK